jgi:hypothetical protein
VSRAQQAAERIRVEIPLIRVLEDYGYQVDSRGEDREQQFSCDLHGDGNDTKPSARVYPDGGQFFCFACGSSRDAVALVQEKEGVEFWQAVRVLEQRYNLEPLPWDPTADERPATVAEEVEQALDRTELPEQALERVARFVDNLTRERSLTPQKCAGLWEAHDRVAALHRDGGEAAAVVRLSHKVLQRAKEALHPPQDEG